MSGPARPASAALHRLALGAARLSGWRRRVLAAGLGVAATAALPPVDALPLLVVAFTGLVWLLDGARGPRAAAADGWWFGFGHFLTGLYWVAIAFYTDPERFGWMAPFALLGLAAGMALFPAGAAAAARLARGRWVAAQGAGRVLALALAWTAFEWLRGHAFTGFPWNLAGTAWSLSDAMVQTASVTGAYGLSLITVAAAAAPATLADPVRTRWQGLAPTGVAAVLVAVLWAAGWSRLEGAGPVAETAMVPGVQLRLVQADIRQSHKWRDDLREAHLARHIELTRRAPGRPALPRAGARPQVTHVIWPETAAPFFLAEDAVHRRMVARAAPPGGLVITGAPRVTRTPAGGAPGLWNSIEAIDESGEIVAVYDKFHLVPFGEYIPLRRYLDRVVDVRKLTHGTVDFSAGPGPRTLDLPGLPPVSPLICYEAIFPGEVTRPGARPQWLLNLTNDGWFGASSGPYQHFHSARLRAVEEGLPLVRVANTGISGVIGPRGRVIATLGLNRAGVLDTALPAAIAPPPYARYRDWVLLGLLVLGAGLARLAPRPV